jgi:selenocysteine-specific elongation factor
MIIVTAGHIDHGKSALVEALTCRPMDRHPAERRRGITLDLGFAPLALPNGLVAGVIDVPGHEDLIRTMAAGASGADVALLVVAADEGIMPQTEEHLLVLEQLGVPCGVPVVTKRDLVGDEWLRLVLDELNVRTRRSSVAFAAPVAVSSRRGAGLDAVRSAVADLRESGRARRRDDLFRLPVDRVFSVAGTGTVVTGTCWSGSVAVGAEVRVLPADARARVRGIESHGETVEHGEAGARIALALAGIERAALARGSVIVGADAPWLPTTRLDVRVALAGTRSCSRRTRVHCLSGTAESSGWLVPRAPITGGGEGLARIRLDHPMPFRAGDRFLIRSASPARPIGGGIVLDPFPPKRAAWSDAVGEEDAGLRLRALLLRRRDGASLAELSLLTGLPPRAAERLARSDPALLAIEQRFVGRASLQVAQGRLLAALRQYHRDRPADAGMPLETLRRSGGAASWIVEAALRSAEREGSLVIKGARARAKDFRPRVAGGDAVVKEVVERLETAGLAPPSVEELAATTRRPDMPAILRLAAGAGAVVLVERDRYYARRALDEFERVLRELGGDGAFGIGALRERLGLSRKFLIPLLEWADREGITVRIGDSRRLQTSCVTRDHGVLGAARHGVSVTDAPGS